MRRVLSLLMMLSLAFAPAPLPRADRGADELPRGWSLKEIEEATPPYGAGVHVHVLAWHVKEDGRPLRVESCLVLKDLGEDDGLGRWCLALLYRHPAAEDAAWRMPMVFPPPVPKGQPVTAVPEYSKRFEDRPGNVDICEFLKEVRWQVTREEDWRLLSGAVRPRAWRAAIGEMPPAFSELGGR